MHQAHDHHTKPQAQPQDTGPNIKTDDQIRFDEIERAERDQARPRSGGPRQDEHDEQAQAERQQPQSDGSTADGDHSGWQVGQHTGGPRRFVISDDDDEAPVFTPRTSTPTNTSGDDLAALKQSTADAAALAIEIGQKSAGAAKALAGVVAPVALEQAKRFGSSVNRPLKYPSVF
ncbi:hypothetical protein [Pseudomarimonas arenosa]|uniref:Killing trait domain-containing protein n=1 Tax=Pseudomarimonas arenosa TaxID=2774145 RepID=A0AAW3ZCJ0_9GAMM|nr:hypothetical protein [Pseudomarimonas arenosa]MBD8524113.1 hypothetical protein [Pseudomarimonas arenosa]